MPSPIDAWETALRLLGPRSLSAAELRRKLADRGLAAEEIERTLARAEAAGLVDDRALAQRQLVARAERPGGGGAPGRLLDELGRRGIAAEVAHEAWQAAVAAGEIDPATLLPRRVEALLARARPPHAPRTWARIYNALLRAGFAPDDVRAELRRRGAELTGGASDDIA